MKLYLIARVETAEQSAEYKSFREINKKRREGSHNAIKTKRDKLLHRVASWTIYIPRQNLTDAIQDAISSYNDRRVDRSDDGFLNDFATINSGKGFLYRITVNFLRHRCSPYERRLTEIAGKVGTKEAYILLNQNIFKKIAELYPELNGECDIQLKEKIRRHNEAGNIPLQQAPSGQTGVADFT